MRTSRTIQRRAISAVLITGLLAGIHSMARAEAPQSFGTPRAMKARPSLKRLNILITLDNFILPAYRQPWSEA